MEKKNKKFQNHKPSISQPLNFNHVGHIGPGHVGPRGHNEQHQRSPIDVPGHHFVDQSPQSSLPQPCPGPSIIQNIGTLGSDQQAIDSITTRVTEAVIQKLQPFLNDIQSLLSQYQMLPLQCASCQNSFDPKDGGHTLVSEENNPKYANFPGNTLDSHQDRDKLSTPIGTQKEIANCVPNPLYDQQLSEAAPSVCSAKPAKRDPVAQPRHNLYRNLPGRRKSRVPANKRDCYARALQTHIEDIVDGTLFAETKLPDLLISEECLTEDECRSIREKVDRKDQIRVLVTVIKARDLEVLMKFIEVLNKDDPVLGQKINESVDSLMTSGFRERRCLLCKLKSQINVKYIADRLWAGDCIKDELYNELIFNDKPTGAQDNLWERILESFVSNGHSRAAFETLREFLQSKGHYTHLADGIEKIFQNSGERFECACNVHLRFSTILSSDTSASSAPKSSESSLRLSSTEILSGDVSYRNSNDDRKDSLKREENFATIIEQHKDESSEEKAQYDHPPPLPAKKRPVQRTPSIEADDNYYPESSYV